MEDGYARRAQIFGPPGRRRAGPPPPSPGEDADRTAAAVPDWPLTNPNTCSIMQTNISSPAWGEVGTVGRVVLHVDANSFYASVEVLYRPELRGKAVSVCGDPAARHGIVLASTPPAKRKGVKTGMAIWQARQVCPELVCVPPDYRLYVHFSKMIRAIEEEWTDRVEAFGLDENWLELTQPGLTMADGAEAAERIRQRVREQPRITVSVGVSFNKILAKLGSDMKKPDAVTVLDEEHWRERVWPLPAEDLLYVGPRTRRKLIPLNIRTIGDLAQAPPEVMKRKFGKVGLMLMDFAAGRDSAPVRPVGVEETIKSVGNSATAPHDIATAENARCVCFLLAESVGARLREAGMRCQTVSLSARTTDLVWAGHQCRLSLPTNITADIGAAACAMLEERFLDFLPLRSLGVSVGQLSGDALPLQTDLFGEARREKQEALDRSLDDLRRRFGHQVVQRGIVLTDRAFVRVNPKEEHFVHPVAFLR